MSIAAISNNLLELEEGHQLFMELRADTEVVSGERFLTNSKFNSCVFDFYYLF
jgi:hypothetical protein